MENRFFKTETAWEIAFAGASRHEEGAFYHNAHGYEGLPTYIRSKKAADEFMKGMAEQAAYDRAIIKAESTRPD